MTSLCEDLNDARHLSAYFRELGAKDEASSISEGSAVAPRTLALASMYEKRVKRLERQIWVVENLQPVIDLGIELREIGAELETIASDDVPVGSPEEFDVFAGNILNAIYTKTIEALNKAKMNAALSRYTIVVPE